MNVCCLFNEVLPLQTDDGKCVGLHRIVDLGLRMSKFKIRSQLLSVHFLYLAGLQFPFLSNGDGRVTVS